jgi:hypothetical protein
MLLVSMLILLRSGLISRPWASDDSACLAGCQFVSLSVSGFG